MVKAELKGRKINMLEIPHYPGLAMKANSAISWKVMKRQENKVNANLRYLIRKIKLQNTMEIFPKESDLSKKLR